MSQHIHNLMGESMKGLRDLVDVDCIVGKPIVTASGTTIIPISKVTFGFGSGGSDIAKSQKDDFGGAAARNMIEKGKKDGKILLHPLRCRQYASGL